MEVLHQSDHIRQNQLNEFQYFLANPYVPEHLPMFAEFVSEIKPRTLPINTRH
jgi:hypothetical protein